MDPDAASSSKPSSIDISAGGYLSDVFLGNKAIFVINICSRVIRLPIYATVQVVFGARG